MARDVFGKALAIGDNLMIDAKVVEIFDPEEDDVHVRIELTNGGQSIVLRADAVAKVIEEEAEQIPNAAEGEGAADTGADAGKDSGKEKEKEKEKPKTRTAK